MIVLPRRELIDNPGFICEKMGEGDAYLREIAFPNSVGIQLENKLQPEDLYRIGKKFGWSYAKNSDIFTIDKVSEQEFRNAAHLLVKYMESISFAQEMNEKIQYSNKVFELKMKNTLICSASGGGYLMETGGISGIWAYAVQDPNVEGVQPRCQGRGDEECEVIVAPHKTLIQKGYTPIHCNDMENLDIDRRYRELNKIRPTQWATHSLRDLINSKFFKYKHGLITYGTERFFLCEASFMYFLEKELKNIDGGLELLWNISFNFGKILAEKSGKQDPCKFITDFFPALGFGDVLAVVNDGKYNLSVNYFPWTKLADNTDFVMFRGMLSGVISGFTNKKIEFKTVNKNVSAGYLTLGIK
jgi:hypothetical protein